MFAFFAFKDFNDELARELKNGKAITDRLFLSEVAQAPLWAQVIWSEVETVEITSVGDAVKALKARGKWWALYPNEHHRRAQLIQDQLPKYKIPPLEFLGKIPDQEMGAWMMLDKNKVMIGKKTSSPFPQGEVQFVEDKVNSPSRAYLKLWEVFTLLKVKPAKGARCIDLGSCPGGWTWVLQQVGTQVISVDKAPLAENIAKLPRIEFLKKDAFALKPQDVGPVDWLFSDIICYPARLLELVNEWRASGMCKNFVCTIKFQGETDWETLAEFKKIPNSRIIHLIHNKHEVTWICQQQTA
jgi:23S rRNA (cytidine2498-2'-O)-methyltransferase